MKLSKPLSALALVCGLYQVYVLLMCTLWRGVVILPSAFFRPHSSREYLEQWLDRPPAVPYESQLFAVDTMLHGVLLCVLLLGLAAILGNPSHRAALGRRRCLTICGLGAAAWAAVFLYGKLFGEPYFLFLDALRLDCLCLTVLALLLSLRRAQR